MAKANDNQTAPAVSVEELMAQLEALKAEKAEAQAASEKAQEALKAEQDRQKQTAEELEALKAERDRMAEAAKAAEEKLSKTKTAQGAPREAEELVTVKLFKDNERYKDDVFVAVNGRSFQIKRGVPVKVPRYVADVLEQSRNQDDATSEMMDRASAEFERDAKALGI